MADDRRPSAVFLVAAAAQALKDRVEEVNRLNVFPVPDGDTGTNMSLTMDAVLADLAAIPDGASLHAVCAAIAHGSLMGARGNSGVILSQILRGLCEVVGTAEAITPQLMSDALNRSVTVAYQAVRKPVEGTMLTVLKDSAKAASHAVADDVTLEPLLDVIVQAAFASVRRGPDLLPVLKENGVVDAGGFGLAILAEGMVAALEGHDVRDFDISTTAPLVALTPEDDWDDAEYLYCTEFLLHGAQSESSVIAGFLAEKGGSELAVGDSETFKIHVHTDDPGGVIAWATAIGEVADVHINNMRRQTAERAAGLRGVPSGPRKEVGFVAVAAGDGLAEILRSLGADEVVSGGQTMNPSTAELLEAVSSVNADTVVILPNNKNIVLAARQAAENADRPVIVVPTTSVPQAFAALLAFVPGESAEDILGAMTDAAGAVRTGEVTTAIKDSKAKVGAIKTGDVIGIIDHEIEVIGEDIVDVAMGVVDILEADGETLTVLAGEGFSDDELDAFVDRVAAAHPDLEVEGHRGEQPLYPIIVSVE
jgi:hypothetical protein